MPTARAIDDPTALDAENSTIRRVLMAITGIRVAKVLAWYPDQTADLQLVRRRRFFSGRGQAGTIVDEQPLPRVPVGWWRFGKMLLAGELEAGDEVLVVGMAREFRPWWTTGQAFDPSSEAMHSGRDVFCLPWLSSLARPMVARAARTFYMGREDGTAGISIPMDTPARIVIDGGPAGIVLGADAVSPALMGTEALAALNGYAGTITTAVSTLNGASQTYFGFPLPTPPQQVTYQAAWAAFNTAVGGAQTALAAALTASLAIKTVVE
jgi:hypothetical protein